MATLTTQNITRLGITPTYAAAAGGGDRFTPAANTFLHVKNTSAGAITVTIVTPNEAFPNVATADVAVSVPATTGDKMIGPLPYERFAASDGLGDITYSGVTNLTVAIVNLSQP